MKLKTFGYQKLLPFPGGVDASAVPSFSVDDDIFVSRLLFTECKVSQKRTH